MPLPQQPNLRDYWRIISKRKKGFIITFIIVMIAGLILTREKVKELIYQATAQIAVEGAFVQIEAISGQRVVRREPWVALNPVFLQTQYGIIRSQGVIERAIKLLGWDMQNKEMLMKRIKGSLIVAGPGYGAEQAGSIISISAIDVNPREAMEIANAITQAYIDLKKEERENLIGSVYAKLEDQVREVKAKLDASEKKLEEFKKKEGFVNIEDRTDLTAQTVQQLNQRLIDVRSTITERETLLKTLKELYQKDSLSALSLISGRLGETQPVNIGLKQRLLDKQNELNNLLQIYKEKHPEVLRVNSELQMVRQQVDNEVKGVINSLESDIETNRNLEKTLLSFLQKPDFGEKQAKYADFRREVDLNKDLYTNLLRKLKEMDVTEQISNQPEIKIIELASLPTDPLPSTKQKGKIVTPFIALILGLMVAFLLEYLDNTLKTIEDVENYLDMPVLGVIPHIVGAPVRKKKLVKK
ncbi:MAG: GNVR domain-containing protein [Candidatus Omnitrophota bacterium]|nr:GNVR domain-containing protein [Candidatus Omnitrophota bacterium]